MINVLLIHSSLFLELCNIEAIGLTKISIIRKMPKGYWGVFSEKGKLLGKFKTKAKAVKRLKQIEYFKHHKKEASSSNEEVTYSSLIRQLNDKFPPEILKQFKIIYKDTFDEALLSNQNNPEEIALQEAVKFVDGLQDNLAKVASAIEMGDPTYAGKYIAEIIQFLMRKISPARRPKSINSLKRKIHMLNENELASKKMPASSAIGQAISLTKNILMMHSPSYIRTVLNSIVRSL